MSRMSQWSIRTVLGLLIGLIGLLLIYVSTAGLVDAGRRYTGSRQVAALSVISKPLLTSMIAARVERGTLANGLIGEKPIDDASIRVIEDNRNTAEATYAEAVHGLAQVDLPGLSAIVTALRSAHDASAALRERADIAVRQAKEARDSNIVRDEPQTFQLWVNATLAASEFVEPAMMMVDPVIDQLLSLKRAGWSIRANSGSLMSRSEGAVSSGEPWTPAQTLASAEDRGRILDAWVSISAAAARPDAPPAIVDAVTKAEHDFLAFFNGEQKTYIDTLGAGKMIDIGFAELQRRDTVAAVAIANVAKTALSVMVDRASAEMWRSARGLVLDAVILIVALAFVAGGFLIIFQRISRPLLAMTSTMRRLADHDLNVGIPGHGRRDEIGAMASAVQVFKDRMIAADSLAEAELAAQAQKEARTAHIVQLNSAFDRSASAALDSLSAAATTLTSTAGSMSANSALASSQAASVASASAQASENVQSVAAATEQLSASIQEISRQITQSSNVASQAVSEAAETTATMRILSDAAQKIGDVVRMISEIAGRTNLLALNATIEAARAGDAGKGFAVVASEVKNLATQTAHATQDIAAQVSAMQSSTSNAVGAIGRIDTTIGRISEIAASIAAAIQEQDAATVEIARTIQNTAHRVAEVSANIGGLTCVVAETGEAAVQVLGAADELSRQSATLRDGVGTFLASIRAA